MKASTKLPGCVSCFLLIVVQVSTADLGGTKFASHVTVNTPARSYSHGVGDPLPQLGRRPMQRQPQQPPLRGSRRLTPHNQSGGYPRQKPTIPFRDEEVARKNPTTFSPWQYNHLTDYSIPVLPPSPYKVDSPDPESLWPLGLFLPPLKSHNFGAKRRRLDSAKQLDNSDILDPYLLEGSDAIAAVMRADRHGHLYFHDIPHIESLLANQDLRIKNNLKPHRIGSIRQTWPYNRP